MEYGTEGREGLKYAVRFNPFSSRSTWENERNLFSLESTHHSNIVQFVTSDHESGGVVNTSQQQLYLVTSYYPLGSLEGFLRRGVVSWRQACLIVKSIACGLKHLHSDTYLNQDSIHIEKYAIAHRWVWPLLGGVFKALLLEMHCCLGGCGF